MKVKEYIKPKQQYTPPSIYVKVLQMESKLLAGSIEGTDYGGVKDPNDPETQPDDTDDPTIPFP